MHLAATYQEVMFQKASELAIKLEVSLEDVEVATRSLGLAVAAGLVTASPASDVFFRAIPLESAGMRAIYVGYPDGSLIGSQVDDENGKRTILSRVADAWPASHDLFEYATFANGTRNTASVIQRTAGYIPALRPWYQTGSEVVSPGLVLWTPPYTSINTAELMVTVTFPVYDPMNASRLLAIAAGDLTVHSLHDGLQSAMAASNLIDTRAFVVGTGAYPRTRSSSSTAGIGVASTAAWDLPGGANTCDASNQYKACVIPRFNCTYLPRDTYIRKDIECG